MAYLQGVGNAQIEESVYRNDACARAHGVDVELEHLVLHQLAHFALLLPALRTQDTMPLEQDRG